MKIIVGLGNPGREYEKTKHNIGFEIIKELAKNIGAGDFRSKFQGYISEGKISGEKVILLMPQTYMNLSGNSVAEVIKFYKADPVTEMMVIYDDMDLPLGKIRIREKGSAGGHNGMKSIISHVGSEFIRIKCGIGKPETKEETVNFVLSKFSKSSEQDVSEMIQNVVNAVKELSACDRPDNVMNKYN